MAEMLDALETEGRLGEAADLDRMSTTEQVMLMSRQDLVAAAAVAAAHDSIVNAVDATVERLRRGGRLIELGAGTPGRLAVLDAAECGPTFGIEDGQVIAVMAGGIGAVREAVEDGEDDEQGGRADLLRLDVTPDDVIVVVSASGRTPYVLAAAAAARERGALTIAVVNNPGSPIAAACDQAIEVLTGPEVVSGSTRLKAGTAQKLVLNAISTLTMVQLGHTYGDLMVDLRGRNEKLRRRAQRIVAEATGASEAAVATALAESDGDAKVATVMLLAGIDAEVAHRRLEAADGHVRKAAFDA
jgi:N-acetylmuramic acid 6-phosphate etherase